jgi:hypothetical protein
MDERGTRVREVRRRLAQDGLPWTRHHERDFETVAMPERDCDPLRDLLIAERVEAIVEVGLAYASSALAVGEALVTVAPPRRSRLWMRRRVTSLTSVSGAANGRSGRALVMPWWGLCSL